MSVRAHYITGSAAGNPGGALRFCMMEMDTKARRRYNIGVNVLRNRRKQPEIARKGKRGVNNQGGGKGFIVLAFALFADVFIVRDYSEDQRPDGLKFIKSRETALCPDCGGFLTGYDRRRRSVVDGSGSRSVYLLRRLYCRECGKLHLEMPVTMQPQKHYDAQIIEETINGSADYCPADNSTMRRWKKERRKI